MRQSPEMHFTRWDGLVILLVVLLSVLSAVTVWGRQEQTDRLTVVVSVDGEEVERCPLEEFPKDDGVYASRGYTLRVRMGGSDDPDGLRVQVVESDCPTQDCVHTGGIYKAGQSIVCLPARIMIRLEGTVESGGPDVVIG